MDPSSAPPAELPHDAGSPAQISRFVADVAQQAPSVYNTSPWWFSATDTDVCVHADVERKLGLADPVGRELTISCGAAVFTARVAMRNLGLMPLARVLPEPDSPNLIARIGWTGKRKPPGDYERQLFTSITTSRTQPLPMEQSAAPQSPGIVAILTTAADQRTDWISAGQALQRLRLVAGLSGVEVAIDAEPLEFAQLRDFISAELVKPARAQLVLRFGSAGRVNSA